MALSCLLVLWQLNIPYSSIACSITTEVARNNARLRAIFDHAVRHRQGDIINLAALDEAALSTGATNQAVTIVRPAYGSSFMLVCPVAHPEWIDMDDQLTFPIWEHPSLGIVQHGQPTHNRCPEPCYTCRCGDDNQTQPISTYHLKMFSVTGPSPASMYYELHITNTLSRFAGRYTCTERPPRGGNQTALATVQHFLVNPIYRARDIFVPAMMNVSVAPGGTAEFYCNTRLEYLHASPDEFRRRFIWYHQRGVVMAPENHPTKPYEIGTRGLGSPYEMRARRINNYTDRVGCCHSLLQITEITARALGRYECWFKADPASSEWLVQAAYLSFRQ